MEITLPQVVVFFLQKEHLFFNKNLSLFFVCMNAALYLFHIDSFSYPPLPNRLAPSLKPSWKTDPNEVTCKKTNKKGKKNKKTTKKAKQREKKNHKNQSPKKGQNSKIQKVSRWRRRRRTRLWSGELGKTSEKTMTGEEEDEEDDDTFFWWGSFCFCVFKVFFLKGGRGGRHGDMLGKRWTNRHGDGLF